jgi:ABC-type nitrate/sulfonate/bicarbonate transport system ATPase subunit
VAIAQARPDPAVLLLDEAFTGLDRLAAEELRRLLGELAAAGRASVLVTHSVEEDRAGHRRRVHAGRPVRVLRARAGRDAAALGADYRRALAVRELVRHAWLVA